MSRVSETVHEDGPYQKGGLADAAEESRETFHTNDESDGAPSKGSHPLDKDTRGRKPVNRIEPFTKQEQDEMEELLNDVRGHLGECHSCPHHRLILTSSKLCTPHDSWKERILQGTSCSMQTGVLHHIRIFHVVHICQDATSPDL